MKDEKQVDAGSYCSSCTAPATMTGVPRHSLGCEAELKNRLSEEGIIFEEVVPLSEQSEKLMLGLLSKEWRIHLFALYLIKGTYVPTEAKKCRSVIFGYCSSQGLQTPLEGAVYVGWTLVF